MSTVLYDLWDICQELNIDTMYEICIGEHWWGADCGTCSPSENIAYFCVICGYPK